MSTALVSLRKGKSSPTRSSRKMGICCSRAAAGELDEDDGFPWDLLFHEQMWNSARASMHTKQGWKGANQDAMTVSQVTSLLFLCSLD
jgi:hypothetical protein